MVVLLFTLLINPPTGNLINRIEAEPNSAINPGYADHFGSSGSGNGQFWYPSPIAMNGTHIFVGDDYERIQIFDLAGTYVDQFEVFQTPSTDDKARDTINGITVNNTHIFVTIDFDADDKRVPRVDIYDLQGTYCGRFGTFGSGDGQFLTPYGITHNETHIFVTDFGNDRVQIFDIAGNFKAKFGSLGSGNTQFSNPSGIAVNDDNIFVADSLNYRVLKFDKSGVYQTKFGSEGVNDGQFDFPHGLYADEKNVIVSEIVNNRIQAFDLDGNFVTIFDGTDSGFGELINPRGITANSSHLLVVEFTNNRVQIFERNFPVQNLIPYSNPLNGSFTLTWERPTDASYHPPYGYKIYRGTQADNYEFLYETPNLFFYDFVIVDDQDYYYKVTALTTTGESKFSDEVVIRFPTQITPTETQTITQTEIQTTTKSVTETTVEVETYTENVTTTVYDVKTETITESKDLVSEITVTDYSTKTEETNFPFLNVLILLSLMPIIIKLRNRSR
ncbi:MAG: hypothetical protein GPJ54_06175 [Candidatus Heimdallarchaeota archaeon]|nr:hypothetical protein [Candidatus Heimdallarchaeota archaeon]